MSDALYPAFDAKGSHSTFTASTDMGLTSGWLDMSSQRIRSRVAFTSPCSQRTRRLHSPPRAMKKRTKPPKTRKDKDPLQKTDGATKSADAEKVADATSKPTPNRPKPMQRRMTKKPLKSLSTSTV